MNTQQLPRISIMLLPFILFAYSAIAQTASSTVIGSMGGYAHTSAVSASYNVGETVIATASQGAIVLTQGFEQPSETGVGIDELNDANLGLSVFPNPTSDFVTIRKSDGSDFQNVSLSLYDITGKITASFGKISIDNDFRVDMHGLAAGVYVLKLETVTSVKNIRIVKVQL